ncbi:MAG: response regulator [Rubrivivax sp.]|jgi:response regulator NasT|nr:response regulator [Rubrivivax sp.]
MGKGRILVVDDDRLVLATVAHGLAQAGYEVFDADNGDDAILLAREHRPELALLDIRMEGKSGFDVAEYLRDVAGVPFMFLSAFADAQTVAKVHALGALDYMVKPLEVARIVPAVEAALRRVREGGAGARPAAPPQPAALPPRAAPSPPEPVAVAVGLLMHAHSLTRREAAQRLQRLAAAQGIGVAAQADRLIAAAEELARAREP